MVTQPSGSRTLAARSFHPSYVTFASKQTERPWVRATADVAGNLHLSEVARAIWLALMACRDGSLPTGEQYYQHSKACAEAAGRRPTGEGTIMKAYQELEAFGLLRRVKVSASGHKDRGGARGGSKVNILVTDTPGVFKIDVDKLTPQQRRTQYQLDRFAPGVTMQTGVLRETPFFGRMPQSSEPLLPAEAEPVKEKPARVHRNSGKGAALMLRKSAPHLEPRGGRPEPTTRDEPTPIPPRPEVMRNAASTTYDRPTAKPVENRSNDAQHAQHATGAATVPAGVEGAGPGGGGGAVPHERATGRADGVPALGDGEREDAVARGRRERAVPEPVGLGVPESGEHPGGCQRPAHPDSEREVTAERRECPHCGQPRVVRPDGQLRRHSVPRRQPQTVGGRWWATTECPGGGGPPERRTKENRS